MFWKRLFTDREFWGKLRTIALPLVLQETITASVNLIDSMMVGAFGDASLAAVNLANAFYYLFRSVTFGITAGGNILNAQFWGKKDKENIRRVMGIQLLFGLFFGILFMIASAVTPRIVMGFYSEDPEVITIGAKYLRMLAPSYLFFGVAQIFSGILRSCGNTRTSMRISSFTLILNVFLNWVMIYGNLGCPAFGVTGAAIATLIARVFECTAVVIYSYKTHATAGASLKELLSFRKDLTKLVLKKMFPVMINESVWGLGTNVYQVIYAGISTASIAAYSASAPIDSIAFILFVALGDGCGIIIGNILGAGEREKADIYSKYATALSVIIGIILGGIMVALRVPLMGIYDLSEESMKIACDLMILIGGLFWIRATNYTMIIGVLRAGGDSTYCLIIDLATMWLIGVPLEKLLSSQFGLPLFWVYCGRVAEEFVKFILVCIRFRSKKWLKTLI